MIYVIIELQVKDAADVPTVSKLLAQAGQMSRLEPGCERFEVYHSQTDIGHFVICEHWTSQAALDQHRKAKAFSEVYAPHILPLVVRVPHPATLLQ